MSIDYVIPFVNCSDKDWLLEYKKYVSDTSVLSLKIVDYAKRPHILIEQGLMADGYRAERV